MGSLLRGAAGYVWRSLLFKPAMAPSAARRSLPGTGQGRDRRLPSAGDARSPRPSGSPSRFPTSHPAPNRHVTHADDVNEFIAKDQTVKRPMFGRHRSRAALLLSSHGDATLLLGKAGRRATGTGRRRYGRSVIVSRSSFAVFRSAERRAGRGTSRVRHRSKAGAICGQKLRRSRYFSVNCYPILWIILLYNICLSGISG
jgi:hypothetical protein